MAQRMCVVLIPHETGGQWDYDILASSSMDAARQALQRHHEAVADDAVITVIVEGFGLKTYDCHARNAKQATYRHRAGVVRGRSISGD